MNTCKTCKHWNKAAEQDQGDCSHPMTNKESGYTFEETNFMCAYDGICIEIVTGPDFGCVNHEEKP